MRTPIVLILAGLVLAAGDVRAAPQGQDAPGVDDQTAPPPSVHPGESLSDKLDRQNGVLTPPKTGDEIQTEVPNPHPGTTRVIPPPGTPGGNPNVQPK
jgi:hypothetical protein